MAGPVPSGAALGLLETFGLVAAIEAADAMAKAADVRLVRQQRTNPGLITHLVVGETAAVRSAIDAGTAAAGRVGKVVASHVIPRPADDVWTRLVGIPADEPVDDAPPPPRTPRPAASARRAAPGDYEDRTVRELRAEARDRDDDRLRGRAIASASKDELVAFLREVDGA